MKRYLKIVITENMNKKGSLRLFLRCGLLAVLFMVLTNVIVIVLTSKHLFADNRRSSFLEKVNFHGGIIRKVRVPKELFDRPEHMSETWYLKPEEIFEPESKSKQNNYDIQKSFKNINIAEMWTQHPKSVPFCPRKPPVFGLHVPIPRKANTISKIERMYTNLERGGHFKPKACRANHRVAVIVPYRDRNEHLMMFLEYMHGFLQKQQLEYVIFVIELIPGLKFNRATLMNIGFVEAMKLYDFQCAIFHDVDLLPENLKNIYGCPDTPRHLSVAVNTLGYRLPHEKIFGGAVALTKEQFMKVNGFSNKYFGWGGEDDDMYFRIKHSNMTVSRYTHEVARYTMLKHKPEPPNNFRWELLERGLERRYEDGLNSLNYTRLNIIYHALYTQIVVSYPVPSIVNRRRLTRANFLSSITKLLK